MDTAAPRLRAAGGADRAAPDEPRDDSRLLVYRRAIRARSSTGASRELPELLEARARRRQRHAGAPGALRLRRATGGARRGAARRGATRTGSGRASRDRRAACASGERLGPVELLESLGDGRWLLRLDGSSTARCRFRRTSTSRSAIRSGIRRSTRRSRARRPHRPRGFTSPRSCSSQPRPRRGHAPRRDSTRSGRSPPTRSKSTSSTVSAIGVELPTRGGGSRTRSACWRSGRRPCECSRPSPERGELSGRTDLFITPGFEFRRVDALLTNFHLPRSSLLALVMAFVGVEETRELYRVAIAEQVPLLLVRRCDADPVSAGASPRIGTLSARSVSHMRTHFPE